MGVWGPLLYSDDVALDVKDDYLEKLKSGKSDAEALSELLKENSFVINDPDDGPVFWFALADTQWRLGRLEPFVRDRALSHLEDGANLRRWRAENAKLFPKRQAVLERLKSQLLSPQPPYKKIKSPKPYRCKWQMGDVYAYPFESEIAEKRGFQGKLLLMHKIGEAPLAERNEIIVPICRIKLCDKDMLPNSTEAFASMEYLRLKRQESDYFDCSASVLESYARHYGEENAKRIFYLTQLRALYDMQPYNTSDRAIPKSLFFVGNFPTEQIPEAGFSLPVSSSDNYRPWKVFDDVFTRWISAFQEV